MNASEKNSCGRQSTAVVPEGQSTIARRFNAGLGHDMLPSPEGTAEPPAEDHAAVVRSLQPSLRDFFGAFGVLPGVKTSGYFHTVPPGTCRAVAPQGEGGRTSGALSEDKDSRISRLGLRTFVSLCIGLLSFLPVFAAEIDKEEIWRKLEPYFEPPAELAGDYGPYRSPLEFKNGVKVKTAKQWSQRREEILGTWHEIMGPWPAFVMRPSMEVIEKEKRENFYQSRVRIEIVAGHFEEAYLLVPEGEGPFPAVLVPYYEPETSIGRKGELRDFGYQLTKRGFVTLSIGSPGGSAREPETGEARCQPLSFLAYVAANCWNLLANLPEVNSKKIGIVGHSYGGKWAMFAACLDSRFACGVWSDPGVAFDESRANVNYWERWYLGWEPGRGRKPGIPNESNPRTGAYKRLVEEGHDLHELQALMAPRAFFVSGGAEDRPERWRALTHAVAVNELLGFNNRVGMSNRETHAPTEESNELIYLFFEYVLK